MTRPADRQYRHQVTLLQSAIGAPGSGAVRYAAAMYFYARGEISAEMLEIYRRCCKEDDEDPIALARFEGLSEPALRVPCLPGASS